MSEALYYLRSDVVSAPRVAQWYAWTYLIAPVTAPLYLANRYVCIMESYLEAPELHAQMVASPAMRGGPFLDWPVQRKLPHGWRVVGAPASQDRCLDLIEVLWTDICPDSLRQGADQSEADKSRIASGDRRRGAGI